MGTSTLYLCTVHLLLIWSLLMELKSRHRAKSRCLLKQTSSYDRGGDGDFSSTTGPQARRPGPSAKISKNRFIHAVNKASYERNLRMAGGTKFRSKEQSDVARKWVIEGQEALSMVYIIVICIGNWDTEPYWWYHKLSLAKGAWDRMENVLEYIINITMEINFECVEYSIVLFWCDVWEGSTT